MGRQPKHLSVVFLNAVLVFLKLPMLFSPTASLRRLKTCNLIYRQPAVDRFCYMPLRVSLFREVTLKTKCWNSVLWKIFNVNDINCLNDTQKYFGYLHIDVEIDTRKVKFLSQLSTCKNSLIRLLYQLNGKCELEAIVARHNCSPQYTANQFRCAMFQL